MAKKYYAVKIGKAPGVYDTWDSCKRNVHGFPGAVYKSFPTRAEAESFCRGTWSEGADDAQKDAAPKTTEIEPADYAFVDGSYNISTGVYGFGGYLIANGEKYVLQGSGNDADMASMRNVAGEILGSRAAVAKALELGLPEIAVYYDYMGIEMWASGSWKRNKSGTAAYYDYMQSVKDRIRVKFVKVKGHSGIDGNEEADRLAKEAVGNLG